MHKLKSIAQTPRSLWSAVALVSVLLGASHVSAQEAKPAAAPKAQVETKAAATTTKAAVSTTKEGDSTEKTAPPQEEAEAEPAGPSPEQQKAAMESFEAGRTAFDAGNFEEAVTQFQKAYEAIPSPHAEYWIALSLDKADPEGKDPAKVALAYQTLLNNPGAAHVGAEKVEEAKKRFLELRKFLPAKIGIVSTPPGASVKVDGVAQPGVTPIDLEVMEGTHVIELSLEGYQNAIVDAQVSGGVHLEQQVEMTPLPPPPPAAVAEPEPPKEEKKRSIVPAAVTLGLGGAGLIAGTVFGIMALNAKSKFKDDPTTDNADAAERNALIADMSFGVALTLGITGIVLLTSKEPTTETAKRKQHKREFLIAPYASPRGAGAAAHMTF